MSLPAYVPIAFLAALGISANAVATKVILRYRICSATFVAWAGAVAAGSCAAILAILTRTGFPVASWQAMCGLTFCSILALLFLARALQESDVSIVVPVMGVKIPLTTLFAALFRGEIHPPQVYGAVLLAGIAVALFGMGKQAAAQGGHGHRARVGILLAVGASTCYAASDQFAKVAIDNAATINVVLWHWVLTGVFGALMLLRKSYRQYRVSAWDVVFFGITGLFAVVAIGCLFLAFELADEVTAPNILFSTRSFFALAAGIAIGAFTKVPLERQSRTVYTLRTIATLLLFVSVWVAIQFG